jgi:uncharacterized protein YndB with AHSA1/START domain
MSHYQQSLILEADPQTVYAALTTQEGLRGWWTPDCDAQTHIGGTIHFRFGPNSKTMRIERLDRPDVQRKGEVYWLCTESQIVMESGCSDEWVGTQLHFRLTREGKNTRLDFEHIGLVPELKCYEACNDGWQYFLASLQQFVKMGRGTPYDESPTVKIQAAKNHRHHTINQGVIAS